MTGSNSISPEQNRWSLYLANFLSALFTNSKIFLIYGDFYADEESSAQSEWHGRLESLVSQKQIISDSGGITHLKLKYNHSDFKQIPRTPKTLSEVTQVVILLLPVGVPSAQQDTILFRRLNWPLLDPSTVRNADKHFIVCQKSRLASLYNSDTIRRTKYKVFITPQDEALNFIQYCPHCPVTENKLTVSANAELATSNFQAKKLLRIREYFPDFQRNYWGHILRVSSTDKMGGDLEFATDSNGKTYAKRGVFASAMYHLAEGLNFTAELYQSSAGASTGHRVNGTWVGSVGDVYSGDASFCMLCGMSYNRHFIVEINSPVTYEYIRFAIGPTAKLYTWAAIFWPFDGTMWMALIASTFITIFFSYLFLKFQNASTWNTLSVAQYFARMFLEQSQDIPDGLSESMKIVLGFWLLFVMVGATIYRAKMVTFMTFPVFEKSPSTYDDLIKSPYQIEFHYFPNIAYNAFKTSTNPVIMEVFQKMIKQPDPIKCLQHTLETKSVCIMFTSVHEDMLSRNMSDRFGISPIRSSSQYAFMFTPGISSQKRADFTPNFRRILQTSLQLGLNEWWVRSDAYLLLKQKNSWIKSLATGGNHSGVFQYDMGDSDDVLHLRHLKGAFTVLISGLIGAFIAFMSEEVWIHLEKVKAKRERLKIKMRQRVILLKCRNNGTRASKTKVGIQASNGKVK